MKLKHMLIFTKTHGAFCTANLVAKSSVRWYRQLVLDIDSSVIEDAILATNASGIQSL